MMTRREKIYLVVGYILFGIFIAGLALTDLSVTTNASGYIIDNR